MGCRPAMFAHMPRKYRRAENPELNRRSQKSAKIGKASVPGSNPGLLRHPHGNQSVVSFVWRERSEKPGNDGHQSVSVLRFQDVRTGPKAVGSLTVIRILSTREHHHPQAPGSAG